MPRQTYPCDLADAEWAILEPLVPAPRPGDGRPGIPAGRSAMPSSTCCAADASGARSRTTCRRGARSGGTSGAGGYKRRFAEWVTAELGWRVEAVQHPEAGGRVVWVAPGQEPPVLPRGFRVLERRWVVERTFAWLSRNRRLSQEYEALPASKEAWIYAASGRLLLRRLAR